MQTFVGLLRWPLMVACVYFGYARPNWIWTVPLLGLCALAITLSIKSRSLEVIYRTGPKAIFSLWITSTVLPALLFGAGFLAEKFLNN